MPTSLLILAAYLLAACATARRIAARTLEAEARREATHRAKLRYITDAERAEPLVDGEDRIFATAVGMFAGILWPAVLLGALFMRSIPKPPAVLAHEERMELERLREQARELNLPMPEAGRR